MATGCVRVELETHLACAYVRIHDSTHVDSVLQVQVAMGPIANGHGLTQLLELARTCGRGRRLSVRVERLLRLPITTHNHVSRPRNVPNVIPRHRLRVQEEQLEPKSLVFGRVALDAPRLRKMASKGLVCEISQL